MCNIVPVNISGAGTAMVLTVDTLSLSMKSQDELFSFWQRIGDLRMCHAVHIPIKHRAISYVESTVFTEV